MKCDSDQCTGLAFARWVTQGAGDFTPTRVQATYLLCREHDDWYQELIRNWGYRTFRIGPLADEQCNHIKRGENA